MKLENIEQVNNLVEAIKEHQITLNQIKNGPKIEIHLSHLTAIYIRTDETSTDEYTKQGKELIVFIEKDLTDRIENLKSQLETL